jgi:hypothetical protein
MSRAAQAGVDQTHLGAAQAGVDQTHPKAAQSGIAWDIHSIYSITIFGYF